MTAAVPHTFDEPYLPRNVIIAFAVAAAALIGVPVYVYYNGITGYEVAAYLFYHLVPGFSITAGYHRLFSHRAYQAHWAVRLFFAFWGAAAVQNSILAWSQHHRVHHKFVDDPVKDPYPVTRGLLHAHIGWVLKKQNHNPELDRINLNDLQNDWVVRWQHTYYWPLVMLTNVIIPVGLGYLVDRPLGMFMFATVLRLFIVENIMFSTNSLCHWIGRQPYTDQNSARDSHVLGFFLLGEGYHNYHHRFEYDYRNGYNWYELDPSKWLIAGLAWLGLTSHLKRASTSQVANAMSLMAMKRAEKRLSSRAEWETTKARLEEYRQSMLEKVRELEDLLEHTKADLNARHPEAAARLAALKARIDEARVQFQQARDEWRAQLRLAFQAPATA